MADQRRPNENVTKSRLRKVNFRRTSKGGGDIDVGGSSDIQCFISFRPTYEKGAVMSLPGGGTFRAATNYTHQSWEVDQPGKATVGPSYDPSWGGVLYAEDEGRDGDIILAGQPVLRGISIPFDARNEAATKALNKIADQKINLGENLATLGQTVRLFAGKTQILVDAIRRISQDRTLKRFWNLSANDIRKAIQKRGIPDLLAEQYLAYVYGLRPLMADVYQAHKLVTHHAAQTLLLKAVGTAQRTEFQGPRGMGVASYSLITQDSFTSNSKTKCTIWARIDPNWKGVRAINQLGLLNPLGLAWDLVPFSFCIDWVIPIGPVLYALTAPAGLIFVGGSYSFRNSEVRKVRYRIDRDRWSFRYLKSESPIVFTVTYEGYRRDSLSNWPLPGVWFDDDPLRGDRIFKALALSILQLSRHD